MRLVLTGGGTGGHVYPALEVAREARSRGWEVRYLGSKRGQEGPACRKERLEFEAFPAEPLVSLRTPRGWRALARLLRSSLLAKRSLRRARPDFVFATGGYSAAPVLRAAQSLRIPYGLHEQNAVPGRTIRIAGPRAAFVATVFRAAEDRLPGCRVVRTGMPVRAELRRAAANRDPAKADRILVVGGSQGSVAINEVALATGARMTRPQVRWTHVCGRANFDACFHTFTNLGLPPEYELKAFLEAAEMAAEYSRARLVVGRSGAGTLSELAAFRLRSVLIPYPGAFAQHQLYNAREFEAMDAARILQQEELTPASLEAALVELSEGDASAAVQELARWDLPDASARIADRIVEAAQAVAP